MEKLLFKCHTTFDFRGIVVFIHSLLQIRDILLISIIEGLYNYLCLPIELPPIYHKYDPLTFCFYDRYFVNNAESI